MARAMRTSQEMGMRTRISHASMVTYGAYWLPLQPEGAAKANPANKARTKRVSGQRWMRSLRTMWSGWGRAIFGGFLVYLVDVRLRAEEQRRNTGVLRCAQDDVIFVGGERFYAGVAGVLPDFASARKMLRSVIGRAWMFGL